MRLSLVVALAGIVGCGNGQPSNTGAAGNGGGGSSAGVVGIAGVGGDVAGNDGSAAGTVGGDSGTGTGGMQSADEIHEGLLNAETTGGIEVTRTPPAVSYPTCQ